MSKQISSILIANRGEIALRIIRACKELEIKSVSVYSDEDKTSIHVKRADEAYHIGPAAPAQSYLNMSRIMEVATNAGVDAIHPGYGFLSENETFAELCEKNNIIFIADYESATSRKFTDVGQFCIECVAQFLKLRHILRWDSQHHTLLCF